MIHLEPVSVALARAVVHGTAPLPAHRAPDWPHRDTVDALRPLADHPEAGTDGTFLVLVDGVVVGECGWFGPPVDGEVCIGYGLAPSARGQGTGRAAVGQLLTWVAARGASRVRAEVHPGNQPSLRLLASLGFAVAGEADGHLQLVGDLGHVAPRSAQ